MSVGRRDNRRKLGVLVGVVVLVGAGGWFAGTQVRSPADVAADRKPPEAGPVTVAVEERPLTATVVSTGSLEYGSPRPLRLAGPVGSPGGPEEETTQQRVTKAPVAGTVLKEGDVLMAVSGRPVLVLKGSVPMYRTIAPGTTGDDVTQLQRALRRIGFEPGAVSGTYRSGTASAVTRWYKSKGYPAHEPTSADRQRLAELRQAVTGAQVALLNSGGDGGGESGSGSGGDSGSGSGSGEGVSGGSSERVRELERKAAREALDAANAALSDFEASYGTKIPSGEVVFLPELPARLDKAAVRSGDAATGDIGTVTSSELLVRAVVPGVDAQLLRPGLAVAVETPDGKKATGRLDALGSGADAAGSGAGGQAGSGDGGGGSGDAPSGDQDQDEGRSEEAGAAPADPSAPVQLRITVPTGGALGDRAGGSVKTTIKVGASKGRVLAVPVAAVHTSANGQARVRVQRSGRITDVPVRVGIAADGLVEVAPKGGDGGLGKGDLVVVGE
ncbi:peptidoglycan-binding domain-containing protein [Streptomyces sp. NPDC088124]|uniref:peptidoglycan-binding domain-containing protein n=1 Tax=Streptomyces sp. NPDC088124 TaxID=3154654 RepID=UPI003448A321